MERLKIVDADTVIKLMNDNAETLNGIRGLPLISIRSARIRTFTKGVKCVHCSIEGHYFAIEREDACCKWHLNLYHRKNNGSEIMLTSDHIIAKAKGGSNSLDNRQPMCSTCNTLKSDYDTIEDALAAKKARDAARNDVNYINTKIEQCLVTVAYCEKMRKEKDRTRDWRNILYAAEKTIMRYITHFEQVGKHTA